MKFSSISCVRKKTLALRSQTPARTSGGSRFLREFLLHNENTKKGNVWGNGMVLKPWHFGGGGGGGILSHYILQSWILKILSLKMFTSAITNRDFCNVGMAEQWLFIIHCRALPCLSLLMTGSFLPALNLSTSASDSGGRGKLASIQLPKKCALALVIFLHCILFMQCCHQQQHGVYHERNR